MIFILSTNNFIFILSTKKIILNYHCQSIYIYSINKKIISNFHCQSFIFIPSTNNFIFNLYLYIPQIYQIFITCIYISHKFIKYLYLVFIYPINLSASNIHINSCIMIKGGVSPSKDIITLYIKWYHFKILKMNIVS